jgi:hypothetical protein
MRVNPSYLEDLERQVACFAAQSKRRTGGERRLRTREMDVALVTRVRF